MTIPKRWTVSEDEDHAKGTMTILGKRYKVYAGNLPGLVDAACWFVKLTDALSLTAFAMMFSLAWRIANTSLGTGRVGNGGFTADLESPRGNDFWLDANRCRSDTLYVDSHKRTSPHDPELRNPSRKQA